MHIAAYSPEARGRSERMFGTLQDRLIKELALAGIEDMQTANDWIRDDFLPRHNAHFMSEPALPGNAHVLPVGGISAANMGDWLAAGAAGFGIGGSLYKPGDKAKDVGVKAAALVAAWEKAKAANG